MERTPAPSETTALRSSARQPPRASSRPRPRNRCRRCGPGRRRRALQEGDGRPKVSVSLPAERVRIALAVALAAPVEEEHAVPAARKRPRLPFQPLPARESDHGRTVLRRDVPAFELQPVTRRERDVLVGRGQIGLGDEPPATWVRRRGIEGAGRRRRRRLPRARRGPGADIDKTGCRLAASCARG